jgi:hypothetical protein
MGHAAIACMLALLGLVIGLPLCLLAAFRTTGWQRLLSVGGVFLNLAIFPLATSMLHLLAWLVPFTLAD